MKILLADTQPDGARSAAIAGELRAQEPPPDILILGPAGDLLAAVRDFAPDVVIVDMARPDRDDLDSVRALHKEWPAPVVMFIDQDDEAFMEEAIEAGVTSYYVRGASLPAIKPVLRVAIAVFRRTRARDFRLAEMEDKLASRSKVEAAKRLLMARDGMSEPAAHRFLQRRAMQRQKKLADVADTMLREAAGAASGREEDR